MDNIALMIQNLIFNNTNQSIYNAIIVQQNAISKYIQIFNTNTNHKFHTKSYIILLYNKNCVLKTMVALIDYFLFSCLRFLQLLRWLFF